jgi:4-amino-4-deoxy-L-arabinose transferase-like glycosyltransferase
MYRWRYILGYTLVFIGLISVLVFAALYLSGGISTAEMQSAVKSSSISLNNINSLAITDLPYHLLQRICFTLFGVSVLSIKLTSIIIAFVTAIGIMLLLRLWFKPNVGILASLIAITTGQFLFIAQNGTPDIIYMFWAVWLMLLATLISRQQKFRKILALVFFVFAALSLYTPLSIYIFAALISAVFLHPHLRFLLRQIPKREIIAGSIITLILITPLIINVIKDPGSILTLIGIPASWPDFQNNLAILGAQYLGFAKPSISTIMTPFFELGSTLIILIGIYYVIKNRVTAQSHIIIFWIICLIPVIVLNPNLTNVAFLPLVLLLASGIRMLISNWYELFPLNPYARVGGLIPLTILVAVLVFSGADRYIHGYRYDPNIASSFSRDIKLIPNGTKNLVVGNDEFAFYNVLAKHNKTLIVATNPNSNSFLATRKTNIPLAEYRIDKIITNSLSDQGDRFYLYTKITD